MSESAACKTEPDKPAQLSAKRPGLRRDQAGKTPRPDKGRGGLQQRSAQEKTCFGKMTIDSAPILS